MKFGLTGLNMTTTFQRGSMLMKSILIDTGHKMFYLIQVISIWFAFSMAKHDAPAVSSFEFHGIDVHQQSIFHRYNFWNKVSFCFVAACSMYEYDFLWSLDDMFFGGAIAAAWIYLLFDPILNICRKPKKKWHYLGLNDADGRFWNGTFGRYSGTIKAVVLLLAIIALNFVYERYV